MESVPSLFNSSSTNVPTNPEVASEERVLVMQPQVPRTFKIVRKPELLMEQANQLLGTAVLEELFDHSVIRTVSEETFIRFLQVQFQF